MGHRFPEDRPPVLIQDAKRPAPAGNHRLPALGAGLILRPQPSSQTTRAAERGPILSHPVLEAIVELIGIEPTTSSLRTKRSPS